MGHSHVFSKSRGRLIITPCISLSHNCLLHAFPLFPQHSTFEISFFFFFFSICSLRFLATQPDSRKRCSDIIVSYPEKIISWQLKSNQELIAAIIKENSPCDGRKASNHHSTAKVTCFSYTKFIIILPKNLKAVPPRALGKAHGNKYFREKLCMNSKNAL